MANDLIDVKETIGYFKDISDSTKSVVSMSTSPISAIATGVSSLGTGALTVLNNHTMGKVVLPLVKFNLAGAIVTTGVTAVGGILHDWHERRMQTINNKHQERLQKEQNRYNEAILKEQYRHEEYIITEQRKVLEKMLETALTAYNSKMAFYQAQLSCIHEAYNQELRLIEENISFLEHEKSNIRDNMELYCEISRDVNERYKNKDELTRAYHEAHRNLTAAIEHLKLEKQFDGELNQTVAQLNLIGNRRNKD